MARKRKPKPPAYSRYQQWLDAGAPYWEGVSLFNGLKILPSMRQNLNRRESANNAAKLRYLVKKHFSMVPGAPVDRHPGDRAAQSDAAPVSRDLAIDHSAAQRGDPGAREASPGMTDSAPPEPVIPWSTSALALPPFAKLPDLLKAARIENIKRMRRAEVLHAALGEANGPSDASQCIHLRDALQLIGAKDPEGKPIPFNYVGHTYNRKTREGGRRIEHHEAVLLTEAALPNPRNLRDKDADRKAREIDVSAKHRPGDHFRNATRTFLLPDQSKATVIVWTMTHFNGMSVVYGSAPPAEVRAVPVLTIEDRKKALQELVETMDAVCISWDIERRWAQTGALPDVPEDVRTKFMAMALHKLNNLITNSLRPKVSRWRSNVEERDGDDLVEAQMTLGAAETELALALEVVAMKEKQT